jgi:hypothetical protein
MPVSFVKQIFSLLTKKFGDVGLRLGNRFRIEYLLTSRHPCTTLTPFPYNQKTLSQKIN